MDVRGQLGDGADQHLGGLLGRQASDPADQRRVRREAQLGAQVAVEGRGQGEVDAVGHDVDARRRAQAEVPHEARFAG